MFFKIPEVDAKYKNINENADPIITVSIGYHGKLSEVPLPIADKIFADGAHIDLKDKPASIKTDGNTVVDMAKKNDVGKESNQ